MHEQAEQMLERIVDEREQNQSNQCRLAIVKIKRLKQFVVCLDEEILIFKKKTNNKNNIITNEMPNK